MTVQSCTTVSCNTGITDADRRLLWPGGLDRWSFLPVYSSYIDLLGLSHGRMPCPRV